MSWRQGGSSPQKTSFSDISKISIGYSHSFFQNNKGEIFSCGSNRAGECGLGHFNAPQITPSLIPNVPSNIIQFFCRAHHSLFLDSEGNAFSVGKNFGELGLGNKRNKNVLSKIPNIPPIQTISCVSASCYLIDFEGNLWTFGNNAYGQLGHGDTTNVFGLNNYGQLGHDDKGVNTPKIIKTLKDIQQISFGSCGYHFFAKNSQNQIFVTGLNDCGQLGTGDTAPTSIPNEINSQYSTIWGILQSS